MVSWEQKSVAIAFHCGLINIEPRIMSSHICTPKCGKLNWKKRDIQHLRYYSSICCMFTQNVCSCCVWCLLVCLNSNKYKTQKQKPATKQWRKGIRWLTWHEVEESRHISGDAMGINGFCECVWFTIVLRGAIQKRCMDEMKLISNFSFYISSLKQMSLEVHVRELVFEYFPCAHVENVLWLFHFCCYEQFSKHCL